MPTWGTCFLDEGDGGVDALICVALLGHHRGKIIALPPEAMAVDAAWNLLQYNTPSALLWSTRIWLYIVNDGVRLLAIDVVNPCDAKYTVAVAKEVCQLQYRMHPEHTIP